MRIGKNMRIIIIGGFLGSGKTTTILKLGRHLSEAGKKVAIIVNEIGEIGLDGDAISDTGIVTEELTSGCICCTLRISMQYTLQNMKEEFDPDILVIEPTGIAFPRQIKEEIAIMDLPELSFAPVVTLVDPGRFSTEINEIPRFIETQIKEAEIVCINKVDVTDEEKVLATEKNLREINPEAKILKFSARIGDEQFESLIDHLASEGREIFGTGDKNSIEMSEVNTHSIHLALSEKKLDPNDLMGLAEGILKTIRDRGREINPKFIGHVKLSLKFPKTMVKASVTSADEFPLVELIRDRQCDCSELKLLSAVTKVPKAELVRIVDNSVAEKLGEAGISFEKMEHGHEHHEHEHHEHEHHRHEHHENENHENENHKH